MRLRTLIAAVCLPFTLTAQSPSATGASPANGVARTFLSFGQPYGGWLLLAFDSIPASKYLFHPTPVQQSIGFIAQHLETANYELCSTFGTEKHVKSEKDALPDTIKASWPKDTLITRVRASLEFCAAAVQNPLRPTLWLYADSRRGAAISPAAAAALTALDCQWRVI